VCVLHPSGCQEESEIINPNAVPDMENDSPTDEAL
jgi:hypothetical protein